MKDELSEATEGPHSTSLNEIYLLHTEDDYSNWGQVCGSTMSSGAVKEL